MKKAFERKKEKIEKRFLGNRCLIKERERERVQIKERNYWKLHEGKIPRQDNLKSGRNIQKESTLQY